MSNQLYIATFSAPCKTKLYIYNYRGVLISTVSALRGSTVYMYQFVTLVICTG